MVRVPPPPHVEFVRISTDVAVLKSCEAETLTVPRVQVPPLTEPPLLGK